MNKKEYELIAGVLRANVNDGGELTICYAFADKFKELNPKFDRNKFLTACGVQE